MSRGRLFFTITAIVLLVGMGVAWILSNQNIIQNSWSVPLGTSFGILGVLFGFCQWTLPLPSVESKTPTDIATLEAQESFIKQIYDRLPEGNGALVIYDKIAHVGQNMELSCKEKKSYSVEWKDHSTANIVERRINGRSLVAAIFPSLTPGDYRVRRWSPLVLSEVSILPKQVAEVDWRGQGEKARKRQSLFSNLRTSSFIVGIGGLLFLAHRFMTIPPYINPYFDPAGIILIGVGILLLIRTLFKDL